MDHGATKEGNLGGRGIQESLDLNLISGLFCFLSLQGWIILKGPSLYCKRVGFFHITLQESKDGARSATTTASTGSVPDWGKQEFRTMVSKVSGWAHLNLHTNIKRWDALAPLPSPPLTLAGAGACPPAPAPGAARGATALGARQGRSPASTRTMQGADQVTETRGRLHTNSSPRLPDRLIPWVLFYHLFIAWLIHAGSTGKPQRPKKYCRNKQEDQNISTTFTYTKIDGAN